MRRADELLVAKGSFLLGSPRGEGESDERPPRRVNVEAFYIDRHEVTNAQYRGFLAELAEKPHGPFHEREPAGKDYRPSLTRGDAVANRFPKDYFDNPDYDKHPVIGVDWFDAYAYASHYGRRLPLLLPIVRGQSRRR